MADPVDVFLAYSRKDEALREELLNHLAVLHRTGLIRTWYDRRIDAGEDWEDAIDAHLQDADIVLLLVSASFLASDYCYDKEMDQALEQRKAGTTRVIPVILRACDWTVAPFAKIQALPSNGEPVTSWHNRDEAWHDVVVGIRKHIAKHTGARLPRENAPRHRERWAQPETLSDGATIAKALRRKMPRSLKRKLTAKNALVFTDADGLQLMKVYEYANHCNVRLRCSRPWNQKNCKHRSSDRNAQDWLPAVRVDDSETLEAILEDFTSEWGSVLQ